VEVKVIGRIGGAHRVGELEDMLLTRHKAQANGVGLLLEGAVDCDELVGGLGVDLPRGSSSLKVKSSQVTSQVGSDATRVSPAPCQMRTRLATKISRVVEL
jgi:hypothetical protein